MFLCRNRMQSTLSLTELVPAASEPIARLQFLSLLALCTGDATDRHEYEMMTRRSNFPFTENKWFMKSQTLYITLNRCKLSSKNNKIRLLSLEPGRHTNVVFQPAHADFYAT